MAEMLGRVGRKAWIGTPNRLVFQTGPVECVQCLRRESQAVIVEGKAGIAPITGDVDVFDPDISPAARRRYKGRTLSVFVFRSWAPRASGPWVPLRRFSPNSLH
jgi:hypothetical protein